MFIAQLFYNVLGIFENRLKSFTNNVYNNENSSRLQRTSRELARSTRSMHTNTDSQTNTHTFQFRVLGGGGKRRRWLFWIYFIVNDTEGRQLRYQWSRGRFVRELTVCSVYFVKWKQANLWLKVIAKKTESNAPFYLHFVIQWTFIAEATN